MHHPGKLKATKHTTDAAMTPSARKSAPPLSATAEKKKSVKKAPAVAAAAPHTAGAPATATATTSAVKRSTVVKRATKTPLVSTSLPVSTQPRHTDATAIPTPSAAIAMEVKEPKTVPRSSARLSSGPVSAPAAFAQINGERYEPIAGRVAFSFQGQYDCIAVVRESAALWAANRATGCLDIYSCVTGQLTVSLPPLGADVANYNQRASSLSREGSVASGGVLPTALHATEAHMWVGYSDGTVAVFDHLVNRFLTKGHFHEQPIVAFAMLKDNTIVSASEDGVLVHWDTERKNFEAITRVMGIEGVVSKNQPQSGGRLTCIARGNTAHVVLCGLDSGCMFGVDIRTGQHTNNLRGHTKRVNDLTVIGDYVFSCSEDSVVAVWRNRLKEELLGGSCSAAGGCKLLKRISVQPCVRSLLADEITKSLFVAYADGLIERWSANADDNFGVEEVIQEGMTACRQGGGNTITHHVRSLHALSAVEAFQVLSLSSNGTNNVWYGHYNALEDKMSRSIVALNQVVAKDTEDTAAWRERLGLLKQKEIERKQKYVIILEQLNEQRILLKFYEHWKGRTAYRTIHSNLEDSADQMENRNQYQLTRRYFTKWASFYDAQQKRFRRYFLANALAEATTRARLTTLFARWQAAIVRHKVHHVTQDCVGIMEKASQLQLLSTYFLYWCQWRGCASRRQELAEKAPLLMQKARQQTLRRAFANWMSAIAAAATPHGSTATPHTGDGHAIASGVALRTAKASTGTALEKYTQLYATMLKEKQLRSYVCVWRRWVDRRRQLRSLEAVAALRERQVQYCTMQRYFSKFVQYIFCRRLEKSSTALAKVEAQLRDAEQNHTDVFEKLQLQKQIDVLQERQENEAQELSVEKERIAVLEAKLMATRGTQEVGLPSVLPTDTFNGASSVNGGGGGAGPMSANAGWLCHMVDQQRLSPSVLSQMSLDEATQHVFAQLKGNVLNMYTDIGLFRQVHDRRKGGASAASIFLEAFSEVKRLIVSTLKPNSMSSKGAGAGRAVQWPLCMEALDQIPSHHVATVLNAIKVLIVSFDLIRPEDTEHVVSTCEEIVSNADWIFLIARACYMQRKPILPVNNRA